MNNNRFRDRIPRRGRNEQQLQAQNPIPPPPPQNGRARNRFMNRGHDGQQPQAAPPPQNESANNAQFQTPRGRNQPRPQTQAPPPPPQPSPASPPLFHARRTHDNWYTNLATMNGQWCFLLLKLTPLLIPLIFALIKIIESELQPRDDARLHKERMEQNKYQFVADVNCKVLPYVGKSIFRIAARQGFNLL